MEKFFRTGISAGGRNEVSVTISASSFFLSTFFLEEQKESGHPLR
jgi:hypothetical protein